MHHQKFKKLKKTSQPKIVDLSDNGPMTSVDFVTHLDFIWRDKSKRSIKVLNKHWQMSEEWIRKELPYYKEIWDPRGINIRWDRRQRSFFLSVMKIK
jgi:hypothetical protein|tara:strand:+ start:384 stop:674 length:291 start_codon:yes stop_codon:yes gene_type:complete